MADNIRRRRNTNKSLHSQQDYDECCDVRPDSDEGRESKNHHFFYKFQIPKTILALMLLSFIAGCVCSSRTGRSDNNTSSFSTDGRGNSLLRRVTRMTSKSQFSPSSAQFYVTAADKRAPPCSFQPLTPDQVGVTLVTQTSEDRLWMMEHHCRRWGKNHYISVAVHSRRTRQAITKDLVTMGCDKAYLIVNVVPQHITIVEATGANAERSIIDEYPINRMRNVAIAAAVKTSHIFYVDIDFWTSQDLSLTLDSKYVRQALAKDDKLALVIPALAIYRHWCENDAGCDEMNVERMPKDASDEGKSKLLAMVKAKELTMFDPYNPAGHQSTGYHEWFRQKKGKLRDIPCIRSNRYEPYVVFRRCDFVPPFQEAFTGYGKNKMTWAMHIRRAGWKFEVLGDGFVVHFPHVDSPSRVSWNKRPKMLRNMMRPAQLDGMGVHIDWKAFKRGQIDSLYLEFKAWLKEKVKDESRVPICSDGKVMNDDDGKLWIEHSKRMRR